MSILSFDEMVLQMRGQGIPQHMAEAAARRELGMLGPIAGAEIDDGALEDKHVDEADKLVRALGGHVVRNSQKRASKVTPGIPDRIYFFPSHRRAFWWEAKKDGGKMSSAQEWFAELCAGCGWLHVAGPLVTLENMLMLLMIGRKEPDGTWTPLPFHPLIEER